MNNPSLTNLVDEFRTDIPKRMQRENIPGLSVAIVDAEATLWEMGFGVTDQTRKLPVTARTIFSLQSCSKTFTATAIMLAVQDRILNLSTPIAEYLPGLALQSRFDQHPEEIITLRHLLSHKAGFTHEAPVGNNFVYDTDSSTFEAHIESIHTTWLRFPVGQRFSYSNLGIDLAGYILQLTSGILFIEYLKAKLFEPLGMGRSSFDFKVIAADEDRAVGHDGFYEILGKDVPLIVPMIPSAGIYCSAGDTARFIRFHLNRGRIEAKKILDRQYLDEIYTIPQPVAGQMDGYGLGIAVNRHKGYRRYTHSGGGFGFLSDMLWYPELDIGIVVLTNSSNHHLQGWYANHLLDKILDLPAYKDRTSPASSSKIPYGVPAPIKKNIESLENIAGHYVGRVPDQCRVKPVGDKLTIRFGWDKKPKPLVFYADDEAYVQNNGKSGGDQYRCYRFVMNENGKPSKPSHFISIDDGNYYDYNEGLSDLPGAYKRKWRRYQGDYSVKGGLLPILVKVYRHRRYLYLNFSGCQLKLEEQQPGLFFTTTGETLDFRGENPVFAGVTRQKIGFRT